jgi:serine-type D-Ala-D-Ala carboxypeptidase (penicillin-binding protein 5/6)
MIANLAKVAARRIRPAVLVMAAIWPQLSFAEVDLRLPPAPPPGLGTLPVALLVDLGSGRVLYARNPDLRFLPASMTKVMTAYVAFEQMAQGKLARDQVFVVPPETAQQWSGKGTSMYLLPGEKLRTDDLLRGIMTASANDAAIVLAKGHAGDVAGWTALMNDAAQRLGMENSFFASANGWPDGGRTFVSARDLVRLSSALIRRFPADYAAYSGRKQFVWRERVLFSHDPVSGVVAGADGIKTGYTREAGYNFLGSAQRDGRRLVMVTGGARSEAQRAEASRALLEWGFAQWRARPLFAAGQRVALAQVQGGKSATVALTASSGVHATLARTEPAKIGLRTVYSGPIKAPIARGQTIAQLEISIGGGPVSQVPLVAAEAVGAGGPLDRLRDGFWNLIL